jgi:hypothetical protein
MDSKTVSVTKEKKTDTQCVEKPSIKKVKAKENACKPHDFGPFRKENDDKDPGACGGSILISPEGGDIQSSFKKRRIGTDVMNPGSVY